MTDIENMLNDWKKSMNNQYPKTNNRFNTYLYQYEPRFKYIRPPFSKYRWINNIFYKEKKITKFTGCYFSSVNKQDIS